ncbi:Eco57I restriction-modification methylase domain-containing protein [Miltoncostaea oceani]|uniref:Eco57I restriction-modification methylase domain-containing protein n=1 Tax=Miltoncostaea oceani TaxID=2843216 RepID=UPI001C3D29E4|nr:DNA methyltransferase [Miltoncostaea oceani]
MRALSSPLRRQLESAVLAARRAAEAGSRAALDGLSVFERDRPAHLSEEQAALRIGLRQKWRQLGGGDEGRPLLVAECAYEQWHRLLFARFLAENGLLLHPEYKARLTLAECEELAPSLGEPDGWAVAARFAAEILPGIFRLDDPCVRLRLAPEGRFALEQILEGLPSEVFGADDSLGWVYQFWQKDKKDEINASERKIGGADLGPVTQLFTENYMVRFLLENSLGAWWAARHPDSPLIAGFEYLRFDDDGAPAAGSFDGWPKRVAEVTVMDPCCGSGHFLVEAFSMLWQMRVEEEGLDPVEAQDAVLRDNLFGLEIDPRCVEIAMFAVALKAWKDGGGWRQLPVPNIACSGIPVKAPVEEWKALAEGDQRLEDALVRLHGLFRDADTLGSLIDPQRTICTDAHQDSFYDVQWDVVPQLLATAASQEELDPGTAVIGGDATALARAAVYLARRYTLVATNVPYLQKARQATSLRRFIENNHWTAREDLATAFIDRSLSLLTKNGVHVVVCPRSWFLLGRYREFREELLRSHSLLNCTHLGARAFEGVGGEVVNVGLAVVQEAKTTLAGRVRGYDVSSLHSPAEKAVGLRIIEQLECSVGDILNNPDARMLLTFSGGGSLLSEHADALGGITTGDSPRFRAFFWEILVPNGSWVPQQGPPDRTGAYRGREHVLRWELGTGALSKAALAGATIAGRGAWNRSGVAVRYTGDLPVTLYEGQLFENVIAVIVPRDSAIVPAIWHFCSSREYSARVREIDHKIGVTANTLAKVPFDVDHWRKVAEEAGPLPEPFSDDPTQWLFQGRPEVSTSPLQVGVGRLVGYRWPEQPESDDLDPLADSDGIVCLPAVAGEAPAADRLQQLLGAAFGEDWSAAKARELLEQAGSKKKSLVDWLRDEFFKQHCALFGSRPFVWHIWDGRPDGFSALVNYHRLDRRMLERLTYTYLGQDWMERVRAEVREEVAGADERLAAAQGLQRRLELILEGEDPYDIYVRWKDLHEQPVGWEPDLNDGVRLNVRPFVTAGVLRAPFNVKWGKDRGKNPDGSERHNDLHLSLADKREARHRVGTL